MNSNGNNDCIMIIVFVLIQFRQSMRLKFVYFEAWKFINVRDILTIIRYERKKNNFKL